MQSLPQRGPLETVLMVGAPFALAVLELFHPHPGDVFQLPLRVWLEVHYAQILLFPLAALAVVLIVRGNAGLVAGIARVAMFAFAVTFVAFDTAAGVVTGVLVQAAQASGAPQQWRAPVLAVWTHPIIGGSPDTTPLLAVAGSVAWSVGLAMTAIVVRRCGGSWIAALLLLVSSLGLSVFRTHAWPGGPVSFGALAIAAAWIRWERTGGRRVTAT